MAGCIITARNSPHLLLRMCGDQWMWSNGLTAASLPPCLFAAPTAPAAATPPGLREESKGLLAAQGSQRSDVYGERLTPSAMLPSASGTRI
jgi:hypothetical protein